MPSDHLRSLPFHDADRRDLSSLYARHGRSGRGIYLSVVLFLVAALGSLPFIHVGVGTYAPGVVRPQASSVPITTAAGGRVLRSNLRDNLRVAAGDTLLVLASEELSGEVTHLEDGRGELLDALADLDRLIAGPDGDHYPTLRTTVYQRDYQAYRNALDEADLALAHATRQYERQQTLYKTGTIARADYEEAEFNYGQRRQRRAAVRDRYFNRWTQERARHRREATALAHRMDALHLRARHFVLTAPTDGDLLQQHGLQAGANVSAGQQVAVLSPDGCLRLEALVSPNDIGILRPGGAVTVRVDAFDHHRWGILTATVTEIGRDARLIDGRTYFPVYCELDRQSLALPNGFRGQLRKGMTAVAHFSLGRRTLGQLLFDRLQDWLSPAPNKL